MKRAILLAVVIGALAAFFLLDLQKFVSVESFEASRARIEAWRDAHGATAMLAYFLLYVAIAALSLPASTILSIIGGALFGLVRTTIMVSFAASIGATLAFLISRVLLGAWVQARYAGKLAAINAGVEREGAFYLFALRLVPVFPYFIVNLVMGLTRLRTATFFWASLAGMLPLTVAYVYAGTQLGQLRLSPGLLVAFAVLGVLPLLAKRLLDFVRARHAARGA